MPDLTALLTRFRTDPALFNRDEASIKQAVILPLLHALGWDPFNIHEVAPEYGVESQRVDYALRDVSRDDTKVFVEAKRGNEELEKHERQLLEYAFKEGVDIAVLTNGAAWWLYLPTQRGSWDQRKFYTIQLLDQEPVEVAQRFDEFLRKSRVTDGSAVENAKKVMKSRQRQSQIAEALPKAWEKLVGDPDELLIDLIADTTENICGFKPEPALVRDFLKTRHSGSPTTTPARVPWKPRPAPGGGKRKAPSYAGKQIASFSFLGRTYTVQTFREMLVEVCSILYAKNGSGFDKVQEVVGKKRIYFSTNPKGMWEPRRIKGSNLYVETHFSADMIVGLAHKVLAVFGHDPGSLTVNLR